MTAHVGRGNRMPESTFAAIVRAVRSGATLEDAAAWFGYVARTVYRAADRDPMLRLALDEALLHRGRYRIRRELRIAMPPTERPAAQPRHADRCPAGCACDVCAAEQLLIAHRRRFLERAGRQDTPRPVPLSPHGPGGVSLENPGTATKTEHDRDRTDDDGTA